MISKEMRNVLNKDIMNGFRKELDIPVDVEEKIKLLIADLEADIYPTEKRLNRMIIDLQNAHAKLVDNSVILV